MKEPTVDHGELVLSIERSLREGKHGLKALPRLIKASIKENAWKEYYSNTLRKIVTHDTFESFIIEHPPDGLGSTVEQIGDMIRHDAEALTLYSELVTAKPHIHKSDSDNITIINDDRGTSKPYALRKLHKDRPDLHQQVLNGDISSHQAMVQAGFRKKTATVVLEPDKVIDFIHKHFDQEDIVYIKDRL